MPVTPKRKQVRISKKSVLQVPSISVTVEAPNRSSGTYGDIIHEARVNERGVNAKYDVAGKLRALADFISQTDGYEIKDASIFVLLRLKE